MDQVTDKETRGTSFGTANTQLKREGVNSATPLQLSVFTTQEHHSVHKPLENLSGSNDPHPTRHAIRNLQFADQLNVNAVLGTTTNFFDSTDS